MLIKNMKQHTESINAKKIKIKFSNDGIPKQTKRKMLKQKNSKITQHHKRLNQLRLKRIEHVQKRVKSLFQPFFQALPFRAVT